MKRAMEISLLGDRFDAATAERWGLLNKIVKEADLDRETKTLAQRLASGPTYAYARTKALISWLRKLNRFPNVLSAMISLKG